MGTLRLESMEKIFPGGQAAVAGVDLEVAPGELVVLLGPSGCGKSTLLRMIAGIETPTRGRVFIDDEDVTQLPPQQRDVAMVFQNYALYPHMSVRDNLGFGLKMRGGKRPEVGQRVEAVAASLGLEELLARKPAQLSGGQRQRVALGRAIARQAKVFLLDEPLSNLDAQLRVHTRMELARLHRQLRVPMVYVTHDQEEAMTLGDRVVVMRAGLVLQVGPPLEIYAHPATQFVAGFVGSPRMNFIPGTLVCGPAGTPRLELLGTQVDLDPGVSAAGPRPVIAGIRPEDIAVLTAGVPDVEAQADVVEPLGRETLLHVVVPAKGAPPVELRVLTSESVHVAPGASIGLHFRRDRLHLFDPTTEVRLGASA